MSAAASILEPLRRRVFAAVPPDAELLPQFVATRDPGAFRAGFVTSRRIGGAVVRNRVRRRLREIVRRHQHEIIPGLWIVLVARAAAAQASSAALEDEWLRLVKRASILRP